MKKKFSDSEKLKYYRDRSKKLEQALELAYEDILYFINIGNFEQDIEWNSGYIIDLLPKKKIVRKKLTR